MNQIETLRREHTCPDCSGSFMPVSHPAPTAAEPGDREAPVASTGLYHSAAADLARLRSLIWYRGDLTGELC